MNLRTLLTAFATVAFSPLTHAQTEAFVPDTLELREFEIVEDVDPVYVSSGCGIAQDSVIYTECFGRRCCRCSYVIQEVSIPDDPSGEEEWIADTDWRVYPNPTTDLLILESDQLISQWMLFDLNGKMLRQQRSGVQRETIDLQSFPAGTYFLRWQQGEEVLTSKVVRQ